MVMRMVDIPSWVEDFIVARANAAGLTFDEALVASIDMRVADPHGETLGWAVARGEPARVVARRTRYSRSTVEDAATRYRRRRS